MKTSDWIMLMKKMKQKKKGFLYTEYLNTETEKDKVMSFLNLNKTKFPHLASFAR